jgi:hypothetical protein
VIAVCIAEDDVAALGPTRIGVPLLGIAVAK